MDEIHRVYLKPKDWAEHKGVMVCRQKVITAAFGHTLLTLEQIRQAFTIIYYYELGSYQEVADAFEVTDSTVYRWRKSWEQT